MTKKLTLFLSVGDIGNVVVLFLLKQLFCSCVEDCLTRKICASVKVGLSRGRKSTCGCL